MKPVERRIWLGIFLVIGSLATLGEAGEVIDMPTYIPAPTDRLSADQATIGPPYRPELLPDGSVPGGVLLVSGNAGIGTATPRSNPPNGISAGNLDANDVYLRSAGRWASQLSPGGGGPVASGENPSLITHMPLPPKTYSLVSVTIASAGRPIVAIGKVSVTAGGYAYSPARVEMYRDGSLVDSVTFIPGYRAFGVVTKMETLPAGNHVFELKVVFYALRNMWVYPGEAKLVVMQI